MGIEAILGGVAVTVLTALSGQVFRWFGRKIDTLGLTRKKVLDDEIRAALRDGVETVGQQTVDQAREAFIDGKITGDEWQDIKRDATERAREYALTVLNTRAAIILEGLSGLAVEAIIRALVDDRTKERMWEERELAEATEEYAAKVAARKKT